MSSYYEDDEDLDIHVRRSHSPHPVRYVQSPPRPRSYYGPPAGPSYLVPERHTTVISRSRSRERSRSRDRRSSPPLSQPPAPVIINNRIYQDHSSDEEDVRRLQLIKTTRRRHGHSRSSSSSSSRSRSRSRSHSHSHSRSRSSVAFKTREEWEAEQARLDLERLQIATTRDKEQQRLAKEYREEAELQRAKQELNEAKAREARAKEKAIMKQDLELQRLREEDEEAAEKKRREKEAAAAVERYRQQELDRQAKEKKIKEEKEKEAAEAVERYKQKEAERIAKEKREKEEQEREYRHRLEDHLIKSGLDEAAIAAIMKNEKIKKSPAPGPVPVPVHGVPAVVPVAGARPTFTRMSRKHLSIETLRTFNVEFDLDVDPEYILIKRWVPEWEQDQLWKHTKYIREKRGKLLLIEEKKHHDKMLLVEEKRHSRLEPEFEWVRKKERKRSKSPSLLMYLAGGRPS